MFRFLPFTPNLATLRHFMARVEERETIGNKNNKNPLLEAILGLKPEVLRLSLNREFHKNIVFGTQKSSIFVVLGLKISH